MALDRAGSNMSTSIAQRLSKLYLYRVSGFSDSLSHKRLLQAPQGFAHCRARAKLPKLGFFRTGSIDLSALPNFGVEDAVSMNAGGVEESSGNKLGCCSSRHTRILSV